MTIVRWDSGMGYDQMLHGAVLFYLDDNTTTRWDSISWPNLGEPDLQDPRITKLNGSSISLNGIENPQPPTPWIQSWDTPKSAIRTTP